MSLFRKLFGLPSLETLVEENEKSLKMLDEKVKRVCGHPTPDDVFAEIVRKNGSKIPDGD